MNCSRLSISMPFMDDSGMTRKNPIQFTKLATRQSELRSQLYIKIQHPARWRLPCLHNSFRARAQARPRQNHRASALKSEQAATRTTSLGEGSMSWKPSLWASVIPRNPMERKPNQYWEMLRDAWEHRAQGLDDRWRPPLHGALGAYALEHFACTQS